MPKSPKTAPSEGRAARADKSPSKTADRAPEGHAGPTGLAAASALLSAKARRGGAGVTRLPGIGNRAMGRLLGRGGQKAVAAAGVASAHRPLPFLDRIQRAFGRHDVRGVKSTVGGDATLAGQMLDAKAYATADRVAFTRKPDLRMAAHEAAHIIQQRSDVSSGVGRAGSRHERHADEVADLVASGQSAEKALDRYRPRADARARPPGEVVQRSVGFEWQTTGGRTGWARSWAKDQYDISKPAEARRYLRKRKFAYEVKILQGDGFHLESDGGDMEWVIDPPHAETKEGGARLLAAAERLTKAVTIIEDAAKANDHVVDASTIAKLTGMTEIYTPTILNPPESKDSEFYDPDAPPAHDTISAVVTEFPMTAAPQMTGGITLEQVLPLMRAFLDPEDADRPTTEDDAPRLPPVVRAGLVHLGLREPLSTHKRVQNEIDFVLPAIDTVGDLADVALSDATRGFLAMLSQLIVGARALGATHHRALITTGHAKNALPMMHRVRLHRMFGLLPAADQEWLGAQIADDGRLAKLAEHLGWPPDLDGPLYPDESVKMESTGKVPHIARWLREMTDVDPKARKDASSRWQGIGDLDIDRIDDPKHIGADEKASPRAGAVFEMRHVGLKVPSSEWARQAALWFEMVRLINTGDRDDGSESEAALRKYVDIGTDDLIDVMRGDKALGAVPKPAARAPRRGVKWVRRRKREEWRAAGPDVAVPEAADAAPAPAPGPQPQGQGGVIVPAPVPGQGGQGGPAPFPPGHIPGPGGPVALPIAPPLHGAQPAPPAPAPVPHAHGIVPAPFPPGHVPGPAALANAQPPAPPLPVYGPAPAPPGWVAAPIAPPHFDPPPPAARDDVQIMEHPYLGYMVDAVETWKAEASGQSTAKRQQAEDKLVRTLKHIYTTHKDVNRAAIGRAQRAGHFGHVDVKHLLGIA